MRAWAIIRATALEILSQPLSLLILLAALVLGTLTPAFHYHQFGEATRMARDAGLSALFTGGLVLAVFTTVRAFRSEIESGTLQMALARPVSRFGFFLAKTLGCLVAYLVFEVTLAANTVTIVRGAEIGGLVADKLGDVAKLWGPSLALGVATLLVPLVVAALLNRFARFRFVPSACLLAFLCACGSVVYGFHGALALRILPVAVAAMLPGVAFVVAAAAFAVRFRAHQAVLAVAIVFAAFLPFAGNYYLPDVLTRGGTLPWAHVGLAFMAELPALAAFAILGRRYIRDRDFH